MTNITNEILLLHSTLRNMCKYNKMNDVIRQISKDIIVYKYSYYQFKTKNKYSIDKIKRILIEFYSLKDKNAILGNCVSFSLTVFFIAVMNGYEPKFIIGTRKEDFKLFAHAWINIKGVTIDLDINKDKFKEIKYLKFDLEGEL